PSTTFTSLMDSANTSANSLRSMRTSSCCSGVTSGPICTRSSIRATRSNLNGSVWHMKMSTSSCICDRAGSGMQGVSALSSTWSTSRRSKTPLVGDSRSPMMVPREPLWLSFFNFSSVVVVLRLSSTYASTRLHSSSISRRTRLAGAMSSDDAAPILSLSVSAPPYPSPALYQSLSSVSSSSSSNISSVSCHSSRSSLSVATLSSPGHEYSLQMSAGFTWMVA
ncbi:hypothetical protein C8R44DRAFT_618358, partial [Mycena epipterygia]